MNRQIQCVLALVLLFASTQVWAIKPENTVDGIIEITSDNFEYILDGSKATLVEFYAPWCSHCSKAAGEYQKLIKLVQEQPILNSRIQIAKVNADKFQQLAKKFDVNGFPTFKFFPQGSTDSPLSYNAGRTAKDFYKYIQEQTGFDDATLKTLQDIDSSAKQFGSSYSTNLQSMYDEAVQQVKTLQGDASKQANVYTSYMKQRLNYFQSYGRDTFDDLQNTVVEFTNAGEDQRQAVYDDAVKQFNNLSKDQQEQAQVLVKFMEDSIKNPFSSQSDKDYLDQLLIEFGAGGNRKDIYAKAQAYVKNLSKDSQTQAQSVTDYMKDSIGSAQDFTSETQENAMQYLDNLSKNFYRMRPEYQQYLYNQAKSYVETLSGENKKTGQVYLDYMNQTLQQSYNKAQQTSKDVYKGVAEPQNDSLDKLVAQFGLARNKQELYDQAMQQVGSMQGEAYRQGKIYLDYMKLYMTRAKSNSKDTAQDTANTAKDNANIAKDSAADSTKSNANSAMGSAQDSASSTIDSVKDNTKISQNSVQDSANSAMGSAQNNANSAMGSAKDTANRATGSAKDNANSAMGSAKDMANSAMGSAKDNANSATGSAKDNANSATGSAKDNANSATGSAKDTANSATGSAKVNANSAMGSAKDMANSAMGNAKDNVNSVTGSAQDSVNSAIDSTKDSSNKAKDSTIKNLESATGIDKNDVSLDKLVAQFGTSSNKDGLYKQVEEQVSHMSGESQKQGQIYLDYMKKGMNQGSDYFSKESVNVQKQLKEAAGSKDESFLQRQYKALQDFSAQGEL